MNIIRLTDNGYKLTNVFTDEQFNYYSNLADTFTATSIRQPYDSPEMAAPDPSSIREVYSLNDEHNLSPLAEQFSSATNEIVGADYYVWGAEIWRDYPGYWHEMHYDFEDVQHVLIVYLDGTGQADMGTYYYEDDHLYGVNYEANDGIILLNSNKVKHGMLGKVHSDINYRKTLYINWTKRIE